MEVPTEHIQADGKTNNVSFKTRPERVDKWKQAVFTCFDESNISSLKSAATLKVSFQTEEDKYCNVKINFYKPGSVVIQGPKYSVFKDLYFDMLKFIVGGVALTKSADQIQIKPFPNLLISLHNYTQGIVWQWRSIKF